MTSPARPARTSICGGRDWASGMPTAVLGAGIKSGFDSLSGVRIDTVQLMTLPRCWPTTWASPSRRVATASIRPMGSSLARNSVGLQLTAPNGTRGAGGPQPRQARMVAANWSPGPGSRGSGRSWGRPGRAARPRRGGPTRSPRRRPRQGQGSPSRPRTRGFRRCPPRRRRC